MSSTIRRAKKDADNPYRAIRRATFEDSRLSWEARGLLGYLLVKPDDWKINVSNLVNQSPGGRDRVYRILSELIEHHYIQRTEIRISGKISGYEYVVFEEPYTEEPDEIQSSPVGPDTEKPDTVEPLPEKPYTVLPYTEKAYISKEEVSSKKETTTNTTAAGASGDDSPSTIPPTKPDGWGEVVKHYESNIGMFTSSLSEMVQAATVEYGSTFVVEAITEATRQNVRKWAYVEGILARWRANGRKPPKPTAKLPQVVRIYNQYTGQYEERRTS